MDEGDLVVRIPSSGVVSSNEFYSLQNIELMPNFGVIGNSYNDGYLFVPDGAGALIDLNSFNSAYQFYKQPVYDNNRFHDIYRMSLIEEKITMPVFGGVYGNGDFQGYLGIIESGEEVAYINAESAPSIDDQVALNKIYPSFDLFQYYDVKIFGEYSIQEESYRSKTDKFDVDLIVRYILLDETNANYFSMAKIYQDYLINEFNLVMKETKEPTIHLDVIGGLEIEDRFLGIPYRKSISLTTYNELSDMLDELSDINLTINYLGGFNSGYKNDLFYKVKPFDKNGKKSDLETLITSNDIYFDVSLTNVYSDKYGFSERKYASSDFSSSRLRVYDYSLASKYFNNQTTYYNVLRSDYLLDLVKRFIDDSEAYENISLRSLGGEYYADYNQRKGLDPIESN